MCQFPLNPLCLEYFYDRATVGNGMVMSVVLLKEHNGQVLVKRRILKRKQNGEKITQPFQGLTKTILRLLESGHLTERERES